MAHEPIRLKYAKSEIFSPGGGITGVIETSVSAKVQNLGFAKEVALRYQAGGSWNERPLAWEENFGDYDLFSLNDNTLLLSRFVLRYSVNGQTFWDNHDGSDYRLDVLHPNTVGGNVALNLAQAHQGTEAGGGFVFTTSWVEGEIFVNNLSYHKKVGIRLSSNGWQSYEDTQASFSGVAPVYTGLSQVERWKFKTPVYNLDQTVPFFRFALFYQNLDTGDWFWDNNFSQDYTLSKADLARDR